MKRFYVYHSGRLIDVVRAFSEYGATRIVEGRTVYRAEELYARTTIV